MIILIYLLINKINPKLYKNYYKMKNKNVYTEMEMI